MKKFINFILYFIIFCLLFYIFLNKDAFYYQFKYRYFKTSFEKKAEEFKKIETKENILLIPKIQIKTRVVLGKSEQEKDILEDLKSGVVLYGNMALPGEDGTAVITGHSSGGISKDKYHSVFALLDKLQNGDEIIVYFEGQKYIYKVFETKIINPEQTEEVFSEEKEPKLILFTCWPIGTTFKRLIIKAKLISLESEI